MVGLTLEFDILARKNFDDCDAALQAKIVERLRWFLHTDFLPDALGGNLSVTLSCV